MGNRKIGTKANWTLAPSVTSFPVLCFISIFKIIFPFHVLIPHSPFLVLETSITVLHGTIRNDDFLRNTARQCWNNVVTIRNNVATMLQRCVALKVVVANRLACLSPLSNWTTATATRVLHKQQTNNNSARASCFFCTFRCRMQLYDYHVELPLEPVDLHRSKPLISLVPFNLYFHCFQG